ncbi:MAG: hypothetical protein ACYCSO_01805 [Cuniculiplasma sp.]
MEGESPEAFDLIIQRIGFLALGILLIYLPYSIYSIVGYSGPFYIILEFTISVLGFLFIVLSTLSGKRRNLMKKSLILIILGSLLAISAVIFTIGIATKPIYTDELAIDALSAKRFLSGMDPYGFSFGLTALRSYGVPLSSLTPKLSGGYVTSLEYPDVSFLLLIPFIILHLNPNIVLFIFTLLILALIAIEYVEKELAFMAPLAIAVALFNINLIFFTLNGITDVIWVTFLALSLMLLQKRFLPGIFFGLSLAAKQLPIFILPFLLIFVYKRYGLKSAMEFILTSAITFVLINLPFILMNPASFFHAIIAPESAPIIGIGFGLAQFYFSGYVPFADRQFFTALMISVWAVFVLIYATKYDSLKYSFTALPVIVLIFNFRLLENYLMYWPLLTLITLPYIIRKGHLEDNRDGQLSLKFSVFTSFGAKHKELVSQIYKYTLFVIIILIMLIPTIMFIENDSSYKQELKIESVTPGVMSSEGYVNCLKLNISYTGPQSNLSLNFRILEDGFLNNPNGFFWNSISFNGGPEKNYVSIHIFTNNTQYFLQNHNSYVIIAYNQNIETWYHINIGSSLYL